MNTKSLLYLWKQRTLFVGELIDPLALSQGAATLCVSLSEPISVRPAGVKPIGVKSIGVKNRSFGTGHKSTSVLIPPGCSVVIDTLNQPVANLNLDVMGADFAKLSRAMSKEGDLYFNLRNVDQFRSAFQRIYHQQICLDQTKSILAELIESNAEVIQAEPRVQTVVDIIQESIGENLSIDYLAEQVNLSVPGLTKLFKKQTGVPIRRYRNWHRLYITATEIGKGKSLTDAAQSAGFVDLPHCTHTFNLMLGMKPSYFLLRPDEIKVITEQAENLKCEPA